MPSRERFAIVARDMTPARQSLAAGMAAMLLLTSCGGGGGGSTVATATPMSTASVYAGPTQSALTVADVQKVIAQAAEEALARNRPAVIAVTDRVGNVLAVYAMTGAPPTATTRAGTTGNTDLQGVAVPATLAAIAKAITGAYLSSGGNAFSTRTASMIVQEHFPPSANTVGLEGGPLFGVQFSQLPCSDLSQRFGAAGAAAMIGPKRSPLGLAADPGGLPLYKDGVLVGGIGVMADGDYGFDREVADVDTDDEELIAVAGGAGFAAPAEIRADRITVDGTSLRYVDSEAIRTTPANARPLAALPGAFVAVTGYTPAQASAGVAFGAESSGIRKATVAEFDNPDAYVLCTQLRAYRYLAGVPCYQGK